MGGGHGFNQVFFDNVRVPAKNVIGEVNRGWYYATTTLDFERSGIGTTAIQLGKAFGATVIVTAGSDARCAACIGLGADHAINHRTTDFVAAIKEITGGRGADVILDMVAGDYVNRNYKAAALDGRIVQIATLNGAVVEADIRLLMGKRLTHTGSTLRPQSVAAKAAIAVELERQVWPLIEAGTIAPLMDQTFALDRCRKAHARMEAGEVTAKWC
ncbi:MAG: zinc-binding dehydrogenase [Rhodobacteraceae bacterium]|nr:zinc-binding dehydrogenase [Paracoccaceae bacterium]